MAGVEVRRAAAADVDVVIGVLDESAAWLAARGVVQWPPAFRPEWLEPALRDGDVWLAERDGAAVATVTLQWADRLWPDDGRAGYVHRFAVCRRAAGLGPELLAWAAGATRDRGRDLLRLDCDAGNARLRRYYEAAGFAHRGDVVFPAAGLNWRTGDIVVSRYERSIS
ncbi:hypothetical protein BJF78_16090 [Pseudonocardia sp. CNS-139]|nr:hypothetical protein BJF78_16090 [Pseudonocardia sp. CNS-139]